ncbi:MAG: C40 family peptidase [Methylohalobius sp.]|nr:C40 family peptidase [Methylohalobius sp.]
MSNRTRTILWYPLFRIAALSLMLLLAGCAAPPKRAGKPALSGYLIAREATRLTGVPYRYGGESISYGFDCSGLVYYVHKRLGISIPRTAEEQWRKARRVRRALPGDLLFFRPPKYRIHVGIYLGGGRFVHAPSTGKRVRIAPLNSYWRRYYLGAGRFWN